MITISNNLFRKDENNQYVNVILLEKLISDECNQKLTLVLFDKYNVCLFKDRCKIMSGEIASISFRHVSKGITIMYELNDDRVIIDSERLNSDITMFNKSEIIKRIITNFLTSI